MSHEVNRRLFGKSLAAGLAALGTGSVAGAAENKAAGATAASSGGAAGGALSGDGRTFHEPAREVPIVEECDVLVCGGGPAGIAAALAAARAGAKTRLLEVNGCLGGVWTAGLLSWILDARNKPGLMSALVAELQRRDAEGTSASGIAYDAEIMKLLLEEWCEAAGVKVMLHTRVVAAAKDDANRLSVVLTESKSGRQAWKAKTFIDCSGDGDLAAQAGCGFDLGEEGTGRVQPMSLMALVSGLNPEEVYPYVRGLAEPRGIKSPKEELLAAMQAAGVTPSYHGPTLFHMRDDLYAMMVNHEYLVSAIDAGEITEATMRARKEVHGLVDALRRSGGVWSGARIVATGEHIGVREGRRIHGLYEVTTEDLIVGARHDDAICRVKFGVDVHSTVPDKTKAIERRNIKARQYDIPLRALIARDVDGLMMAGRCISGDFISHSSYRVTGNAVAMGEAAGATAALAATSNRLPQAVPFAEMMPVLTRLRYEPVKSS